MVVFASDSKKAPPGPQRSETPRELADQSQQDMSQLAARYPDLATAMLTPRGKGEGPAQVDFQRGQVSSVVRTGDHEVRGGPSGPDAGGSKDPSNDRGRG